MRVMFAGTPEFAARALDAILDAGHDVVLLLTQPDRPAGRNLRITAGYAKQVAQSRGIATYQPEKLRAPEQQAPVLAVPCDVMVVAAYGLILRPEILAHPAHGCLNIHASLLPRWRGAAPIQRALLAGDGETGVCIMQMDAGLDTGPVISRHRIAIEPTDTAGTLHDKLADCGAKAIVAALAALERDGVLPATPQPTEGVTYAPKIDKHETWIDWNLSAVEIERRIRAFNPAPGAASAVAGTGFKIWRAHVGDNGEADRPAGTVIAHGRAMGVRCGGGGLLVIDEMQPAGGRRMSSEDFANGRPEIVGSSLGA